MMDLWSKAFFFGMNGCDPILSQIPVRVQKEGDSAHIGGSKMEYKKLSVSTSFDIKEGEGMTVDDFIDLPVSLGDQMAGQQAKSIFEMLQKPSPHGVPLAWKTGELKFEHILENWEKMEIDFGNDGQPRWPTHFLQPAAMAEFKEKLQEAHNTPECREKWAQLVERKRKEFDEREARRRLVD